MLAGIQTTVSATTRSPRPGERDGREYHFLSAEAFKAAAAAGKMLEWVEYGGNLYGTPRAEVEDRLARGLDVILEIELKGARAVRRAIPEAVAVFIAPPDLEELARRLRGRGTESDEAVDRRLAIAATEVAAAREFHAVVLNDDPDRAAAEVVKVIEDRRAAAVPPEKE